MWSTVVAESDKSPAHRCKHTITLLGHHLYLIGGRNGSLPLKDFWRFDLGTNEWEPLETSGDGPSCIQEHTTVAFKDNLYVFGGELGFSANNETPLWVYQSKSNHWHKVRSEKGANVPKGRRGHTALIYQSSALIYGGYCDLRGSSNELWLFHFESESWHLLTNKRGDPPGRHKHSAVIHDDAMWVYGGMTDLQPRSDLCKYDMITKKWRVIKCKYSPGPLHSQAACKLPSCMIIFGGQKAGQLSNELWRFHFATEVWELVDCNAFRPQARCECSLISISELMLNDNSTYDENKDRKRSPSIPRRSDTTPQCIKNDLYRYKQRSLDDDRSPGVVITPRGQVTTPNSFNRNIIKDLTRISQVNISRMAQNNKCYYRALVSNDGAEEETTNDQLSPYSGLTSCLRSPASDNVSGEKKILLSPTDVTKLVYLEHEQACTPSSEDFPSLHTKLNPNTSRNRRSFPSCSSVRFANPLVTPEQSPEVTSDYASCENIHRLSFHKLNNERAKTPIKDSPVSFSNPNYFMQERSTDEWLNRKDFTRLSSPADSGLHDSGEAYEMMVMRPAPPKTLPLFTECLPDKQKGKRACSVTRSQNQQSIASFCVYLTGGKENQVSTFKRPMSMWKLSLPKSHLS